MISPNASAILLHPLGHSWLEKRLRSSLSPRQNFGRHFSSVSLAIPFTDWAHRIRNRLDGTEGEPYDIGHPARRATDCLLLANICVFLAQVLTRGRIVTWGMKNNAAIASGQWWRLLTPAFLHNGLAHVAINCYSLRNLGPHIEGLTNKKRFISVYAAGALGCTALSYLCSPLNSVGASGAIYGLLGAHAIFVARHRRLLGKRFSERAFKELAVNLVLNYLIARGQMVDHWGHIGGFLGGAAAAGLLGPNWRESNVKGWPRLIDRPPISAFAENPPY